MPAQVIWNGKVTTEEEIYISPNNHSFRYGDGCFETMKVVNGQIILPQLHFQRLFSSLAILKFSIPSFFTAEYLSGLIIHLVHINHQPAAARVRLVVYRGDGGLYDLESNEPQFIIQSFPGSHSSDYFNQKGLVINTFPDGRKSIDRFSSIKSNNYLTYVMGAIWARENDLDDCIILNAFNRIADATIANIFMVKEGIIITPPLTEGCINGVMRRYLIKCFAENNIPFAETEIQPQPLSQATEVFLTNATYGIRWVQKAGDLIYTNTTSTLLHQQFIVPLFNAATF